MIKAIYIAKEHDGTQQKVDCIELVEGKGIVGDRNYDKSKWPGQNITLIELEEIRNYNRVYKQEIEISSTRRNIITTGVNLNDLVGKKFSIGDVRFKGVELCEPCGILGDMLKNDTIDKKDVVAALLHKGGLRADVLNSGSIKIGMQLNTNI